MAHSNTAPTTTAGHQAETTSRKARADTACGQRLVHGSNAAALATADNTNETTTPGEASPTMYHPPPHKQTARINTHPWLATNASQAARRTVAALAGKCRCQPLNVDASGRLAIAAIDPAQSPKAATHGISADASPRAASVSSSPGLSPTRTVAMSACHAEPRSAIRMVERRWKRTSDQNAWAPDARFGLVRRAGDEWFMDRG
jgi:hypothetical protein